MIDILSVKISIAKSEFNLTLVPQSSVNGSDPASHAPASQAPSVAIR